MKSIYLLCFIIVLASANIGVTIPGYKEPIPSFFTCLAQKNITRPIMSIMDYSGKVNKNFLLAFFNSKIAKFKEFDATVTITGSFTPEETCNGVAGGLPISFNGTVWLELFGGNTLWETPIDQRVSFVENVVKACQNHGLKVGIHSYAYDWTLILGSQRAGSDILKAVPLWYYTPNESKDFDDFEYARFGTWDAPTMKTYGEELMCDYSTFSLQYYEA